MPRKAGKTLVQLDHSAIFWKITLTINPTAIIKNAGRKKGSSSARKIKPLGLEKKVLCPAQLLFPVFQNVNNNFSQVLKSAITLHKRPILILSGLNFLTADFDVILIYFATGWSANTKYSQVCLRKHADCHRFNCQNKANVCSAWFHKQSNKSLWLWTRRFTKIL